MKLLVRDSQEAPEEASPPLLLLLHRRPTKSQEKTCLRSPHLTSLPFFFSMALDSVPPYPGDLGSSTARASAAAGGGRSTQHRIRKEERTWTADTYAPYDDGHQWRKYGEKKLSNSNFPRFYYRCTYKNDMKCPATKQVQQKDTSDPPLFSVTYFNHHTCNTTSRPIGSAADAVEQPCSRKAVSICFGSGAATEQRPAFLTPPSTAALHSPVSRASQPQDRGAYSSQFQWTGASSAAGNAPVKMEADDLTAGGAGSSSSSITGGGGALSRTLLPIGQSRCIEYFQFL